MRTTYIRTLRSGDLFAQRQLGRRAEAGQHIVVNKGAALGRSEEAIAVIRARSTRLVGSVRDREISSKREERLGDVFAQLRLGRGAEAGQ